MRVACLQFAPEHGRVRENIARADALLQARGRDLEGLRLLVLPEMAFTGYHWRNGRHIDPFLETDEGPTTTWCRRTAARLGCVVCCGLPRRSRQRRLNSMLVAGPEGEVLDIYDKHFLYDSDKTWAEPGVGFRVLRRLPSIPIGPVGLGICMDINPRDFKESFDAFEFANFQRQAGSRLIVFSSAWCANHPNDPPASFVRDSDAKVAEDTLRYWLTRLLPLRGADAHFVCADRVGEEELSLLGRSGDRRRNRFCGCSCVVSLKDSRVLDALGASEEGVLVVDIPLAGEQAA